MFANIQFSRHIRHIHPTSVIQILICGENTPLCIRLQLRIQTLHKRNLYAPQTRLNYPRTLKFRYILWLSVSMCAVITWKHQFECFMSVVRHNVIRVFITECILPIKLKKTLIPIHAFIWSFLCIDVEHFVRKITRDVPLGKTPSRCRAVEMDLTRDVGWGFGLYWFCWG